MRIVAVLLLGACQSTQPTTPAPAPAHPRHQHHHPLGHTFEGDASAWAKRFEGPERDAYQQPSKVIEAMKLTAGMKVADVGTGTGYFVPHLSRAVGEEGRVLALDVEPGMIDYVKKRAARDKLDNVDARVVKVDDPGLESGSVDRILIVNTWHHIPEREQYGKKLLAALAAKGEVWVVDFTMESQHGPPKAHRIPPDKAIAELRAAGFKTRLDTALLTDQYIAIGRRP
ncbi:MAG TPA: class I SAM-dependent methyltransferase [Polyangiaceae bacterium]|nr:class I SAM-dependent methyltransferase [Polyangiaceae bacterium]